MTEEQTATLAPSERVCGKCKKTVNIAKDKPEIDRTQTPVAYYHNGRKCEAPNTGKIISL